MAISGQRYLLQICIPFLKKEGVLNQKVALWFRKTILEKGGAESPMNLVRAFLRRDPNNEAFLKSQGLSEYSKN